MLFKWFKCQSLGQLLVDLMLTNSVFQCLQAKEKKSDLGKCYQPKPKAEAHNSYLHLNYSGYHKKKRKKKTHPKLIRI